MASAYTPGLTVSGDIIVQRTRRLPIKGEVLVKEGDAVTPDTVVARAMLPGILQTIKVADELGVEPKDVEDIVHVKVGDPVDVGTKVAETKGLFGKFFKGQSVSKYKGTIETISPVTGSILVREPSIPIDVDAYVEGTVAKVIDGEGAIIETRGAMVQGIFGIGGERIAEIRVAVNSPNDVLEASNIQDSDKGKLLVGGSGVTLEAIQKAVQVGVSGLVTGGIKDKDLIAFLGYDIGVAITGQEPIDLTILVTEGFGYLSMANRTFELLKSLQGKVASINGATQIRAGVIRPEIIVPLKELTGESHKAQMGGSLEIGTSIRVIREPYFGQLGTVTELPPQLMVVDSGTEVRVLKARLSNGEEVLVPRANVEIIAK